MALVGAIVAVLLAVFAFSLVVQPLLPSITGKGFGFVHSVDRKQSSKAAFLLHRDIQALYDHIAKRQRYWASRPRVPTSSPIMAAFYPPWQETALSSLRANADKLSHVMPEWVHLSRDGGGLDFRDWDPNLTPHNLDVVNIARRHGLKLCPILSNAEEGVFDAKRVDILIRSPNAQTKIIEDLTRWLTSERMDGLNLDFENLSASQWRGLLPFIKRLGWRLAVGGLEFSIDIEANRDLDWLKGAAVLCDYMVLMAYDEHESLGKSGPIASIGWFEKTVSSIQRAVPPEKLVLGMGSYAYDWAANGHEAESLSYQDALVLAKEARDDLPVREVVQFDPYSLNSKFDYVDDKGVAHQVWILDGPSAYDQWLVGSKSSVRGAAVWALGTEDPSIWQFLDRSRLRNPPDPSVLLKIDFPYEVDFQGEGEILQVVAEPGKGERRFSFDHESGLITGVQYLRIPSSYVIQRSGRRAKTVALTFDDGPSGEYSDQVLDVLKEFGVRATFFVIGENAQRFPSLVRRMFAEGHDIGSHSFTHPNMGSIGERRCELELNATQRAIQSILGRSTILFRPPYNADAEPVSGEEVKPIDIASQLGYKTVGELIDPQDWMLSGTAGRTPKARGPEIAKQVIANVHAGIGNVVLLHDGGGDRRATIEALHTIIPRLKTEGYRFATASELMGMTRFQTMPPLTGKDLILLGIDRIVFEVAFTFESFLATAFFVAIALGIGRGAVHIVLALVAGRKQLNQPQAANGEPPTILIAAFNEEGVIHRTISSVLRSTWPIGEIIVVDDGSTDATYETVRIAFEHDERVAIIRQENSGKASALNRALESAHGSILVCIDADTQLDGEAIGRLVRHFENPKVGAVAGNVKVGNRRNVLTRWQALEYITSQNLDRRAYSLMNGITVVPGAIGAWRKKAVTAAGGYMSDTMAEDMDLTWRLRDDGWLIENEPEAIAYTEAPETWRGFFKQRFRWTYGTLQCLAKHIGAFGRGGWFGWVVLPTLWLFQVIFQLLAPLVDLQILYTLYQTGALWMAADKQQKDWQPLVLASQQLSWVIVLYAIFFSVEFVSSFIAIQFDREDKRLLWSLFWQRFLYRQVLYLVVLKSVFTASSGLRTVWGKIERTGKVQLRS